MLKFIEAPPKDCHSICNRQLEIAKMMNPMQAKVTSGNETNARAASS
jgi:hypothetical protein